MGCSRLLGSSLLSAARLAGCELKHATQICLTLPRGGCVASVRQRTARYGGSGVVNPVIKRAGLANNGTSITTARIPACRNTDVTRALRRTRRSRRRCSGSPSTKQLCNEAKLCRGADSGSSGMTHLHRKMLRTEAWNFATPGPANFCRRPAPRSQGCEVARVNNGLATAVRNKFPAYGPGMSTDSATQEALGFVGRGTCQAITRHDWVGKKHLQANISRLNRVNTNGEVGESFGRFGNASFKRYFS